jgi:hypothetical protein
VDCVCGRRWAGAPEGAAPLHVICLRIARCLRQLGNGPGEDLRDACPLLRYATPAPRRARLGASRSRGWEVRLGISEGSARCPSTA